MQDVKNHHGFGDLPSDQTQTLIQILLIILVLALMINIDKIFGTNARPDGTDTIGRAMLEEKYGLRVNLIAVTAAGGFVDVRLMILDVEKAKSLLTNPDNFPCLSIEAFTLRVSQQAKEDEINYEKNGNLFFMFPNTGNAVRKGTPVIIRFGEIALEPIVAQ